MWRTLTLTAGLLSATVATQSDPVVDWLTRRSVEITATAPGHGFQDLGRLGDQVRDKRMVALGSSTHGSLEFGRLRHRLIEYLVEEHGFTGIALEADFATCVKLNHYVATGTGNPARLLHSLDAWIWDSHEVLALIEWMRRHNSDMANHRKLTLHGLNMQRVELALDVALQASPNRESLAPRLAPLRSVHTSEAWRELPEDVRQDARLAALDLARDAAEGGVLILRHALAVTQFEEMLRDGFEMRDRALAANAAWALDQEGEGGKLIVWAHNTHIQKTPASQRMGENLERKFGDEYAAIAMIFGQGSFHALAIGSDATDHPELPLLRPFEVGPPREDSLESRFVRIGLPALYTDLSRPPFAGPASEFARTPQSLRSIGSAFSPALEEHTYESLVPSEAFDGIVFFAHSTPSQPNPLTVRRFAVSADEDRADRDPTDKDR